VAKAREDKRHLQTSLHISPSMAEDGGNAVTVSESLANAFMGLLLWLHQKYIVLRMETTQAIHTLFLEPQRWKRVMAQTRSFAWILLFLPQSFQREPWLNVNIYLCLGLLAILLFADFLSCKSYSPWQGATLQKELNF